MSLRAGTMRTVLELLKRTMVLMMVSKKRDVALPVLRALRKEPQETNPLVRNTASLCWRTHPMPMKRLMRPGLALRKALVPAQSFQEMTRIRMCARDIRVLPSGWRTRDQ